MKTAAVLRKISNLCKDSDFCSTCKIGPKNCVCDSYSSPDEWSDDEIEKLVNALDDCKEEK